VVRVILSSTVLRALSAPPAAVLAVLPAGAEEPDFVGALADPEPQAVRMAPTARADRAVQAVRRAGRTRFVLVLVVVWRIVFIPSD
jgi:hypothetical protein